MFFAMLSPHLLCDLHIVCIFTKKSMIHNRVKTIRESKKISQDFLASELGLNQSQYSRRENGEIKFDTDEVLKLSSLLEASVAELFGQESAIFNNHNQKGGNFGQYISVSEKLIEQYEKRLLDKDRIIELLSHKIEELTSK